MSFPGRSQRAAGTVFGALLKNVEFSARIAELAEAAAQGAVMGAREVLEELSKLGRAGRQGAPDAGMGRAAIARLHEKTGVFRAPRRTRGVASEGPLPSSRL